MKKVFTLLLYFCYIFLQAQPTTLNWAKQVGGSGPDGQIALELDESANLYTAGWFEGVADFDPGPSSFNLTSQGMRDIAICKYDPSGNLIWAKAIGGPSLDFVMDIALDTSGNILATGYFSGTVDFDPGSGLFNLTSAAGDTSDSFICKLDAQGNFIWAKQFGKSYGYGAYKILVNQTGESFVAGLFEKSADFDPGMAFHILTAGGLQDGFILKLDVNGNFAWVDQIKGVGGTYGEARCIDMDSSGNLLVAGSWSGTIDIDPGPSIISVTSLSQGLRDVFILKLDISGNMLWEKHFGGIDTEAASALKVAESGNIYISGIYADTTIDLDPGPGIYHPSFNGWVDFFLLKLDSSGSFRWCKTYGGNEYDNGNSIALDSLENIYLSGRFRTTVDFDPGPGTFTLSTIGPGVDDSFIMRTDSSGQFIWVAQIKGNMNYANDLEVGPASEIFIVGRFQNPTDMDPGSGVYYFYTPSGMSDGYMIKLTQMPGIGISESSIGSEKIICFPNPFANDLFLKAENAEEITFKLYNSMGQEVFVKGRFENDIIQLNTSQLSSGIYFIHTQNANRTNYYKIIKE